MADRSILGGHAIPGDPDAVLATARRFDEVAHDMWSIRDKLSSGGFSGTWEGPAADAFRATVSDLPGELTKSAQAHLDVGIALRSFGHTLRDILLRADALADRLAQNRAELAGSSEETSRAAADARRVERVHAASAHDPLEQIRTSQDVKRAGSALAAARSRVAAAEGAIGATEDEAARLRAEFDDAAKLCGKRIEDAAPSLKDGITAWYADKVQRPIDSAMGVIDQIPILNGIVDMITSPFQLLASVPRLLRDPSWANARAVIDDLGSVLILAAVVAVAFFGAIPSAFALAGASVFAAGAKVYSSHRGIEAGELTEDDLRDDYVGLGLSLVGFGAIGAKAALAKSPAAQTRYLRYGTGYRSMSRREHLRDVVVDEAKGTAARLTAVGARRVGIDPWVYLAPEGPDGRPPVGGNLTPTRDASAYRPILQCATVTLQHAAPLRPVGAGLR